MKKHRNIILGLAISILYTTLPMVFSKSCPHGIQPIIHMEFRPETSVATVGSNIQIYCNASTLGRDDIRHDRFQLFIYDNVSNKFLNSSETRTKAVESTLNIKNISYSDAKLYICLAQLNGGSAGCSRKDKLLKVKDCTNVKNGSLSFNAVFTERMTISYLWKYRLESCDRGFRVFWSDKGPVDLKSSSKRLPVNVSSYEIRDLERNSRREYWVGMSIETTKGSSKIFRVEKSIQPICTSNKEGLFSMNASITSNNTISISWKYNIESCDEGFVLFWSSDGPVSKFTTSQTSINRNKISYELKYLESNTKYWIGMAVRTTKGLSEIQAFKEGLVTENIDDPGKGNRSDGNDVTTPVVIFVVLIICLLAIICTVWCVISRRKRKFHDTVPVVQMTSGAAQNLGILYPDTELPAKVEIPPLSSKVSLDDVFEEDGEIQGLEEKDAEFDYLTVLDEWEVSRELISITSTRLGTGQFGIVKKGTFRTRDENGESIDLPVAVKVLKDGATEIDRSDLQTELRILKFVNTLPHPNILKLIGACTSEQQLLVITEYCSRGNLSGVLKKYREILRGTIPAKSETKLTHEQLLRIAVDVACGMEHLMKMKFVHRDLAARNILVTESWTAKISDFGLARETSNGGEYIKSRRNLLPVKWTAIEALVEGKFTSASDVWSFGVLLWEISNIGGSPYKGISPHDIMSHVGSGGRLGKPERCSPFLYSIMKECWETLPEKRPTFTALHEKLTSMLEEAEITYINVEFMNDANEGDFERYTSA